MELAKVIFTLVEDGIDEIQVDKIDDMNEVNEYIKIALER